MWYLTDDNKTFVNSSDVEERDLESLYQSIRLWAHENQMRYSDGIDYHGVFNNTVSLRASLENILEQSPVNVEIGKLTIGDENINIELKASVKDGVKRKVLKI